MGRDMKIEDFAKLTDAERLQIRKVREFTPEEKAHQFGDANHSSIAARDNRAEELVRRLDAGEPLSKADRKEARRIKRDGL